jgi:DtxR family Mn-dependent transcriptional regulator
MKSTVRENYLKTIFELQKAQKGETVGVGRLSKEMNLTAGTVTGMIKRLAEEKLVHHTAYVGCALTEKGRSQAVDILRRHRIMELFLVKIVGQDWSEVHEEAERLEHAISDRLLTQIDELLGYPELDPHGDPIPSPDGRIPELPQSKLTDCSPGVECAIVRVLDESKDFLDFVGSKGLFPGTAITVESIEPEAGIIQIKPLGGEPVSLGISASEKLLVKIPKT